MLQAASIQENNATGFWKAMRGRSWTVIVDPVDYLKKKWLHIKAQDLLVTVGFPSDVEQGSEEGGQLSPE